MARQLTEGENRKIIRLYSSGLSLRQVGIEVHRSVEIVRESLRQQGVPCRNSTPKYLPSPEQIEIECARLRHLKQCMPTMTYSYTEMLIGKDPTQTRDSTRPTSDAVEAEDPA